MPTKNERLRGRTLVLRYDASGNLLSAKIRGVTKPWLELDPSAPSGEVHWNLIAPALIQEAIRRGEGQLADMGPFCSVTSPHTGRSPNDKFLVKDPSSGTTYTGLTGLIHSAPQFYWARFLLGVAEAGFFPGVIVYLTGARHRSGRLSPACLPVILKPAVELAASQG